MRGAVRLVPQILQAYEAALGGPGPVLTYSKAEHNRGLQRRIGRNKGSIEFKLPEAPGAGRA